MDSIKKILIVDFCNFEDYPIGGYLSFAKNMMTSFGNDLALVGITTSHNDPIGKWFRKTINGIEYDFFALAKYDKNKTKYFLPDRLKSFFLLRFYRSKIQSIGISNVFIQRQEILPAVNTFNFKNICYCFPGMENPLMISKYWYGKYIAKVFDSYFFSSFKNVKTILATGDDTAISEMVSRSNGLINSGLVCQFPSRFDSDIFHPSNKKESRTGLKIPESASVIVTTGRLSWLKGWKFMLDSFILFEAEKSGSKFYMIGEGEDSLKIEEYIAENQLSEKVFMVGRQNAHEVSHYLNSADLFIMGSYKEGWSTSLIEAIACGVPACVTNFSSAKSIIADGKQGYVVDEHDTKQFAKAMLKAVALSTPISNENVMAYAVNKLKDQLLQLWELK